jgi:hypothetical protein
MVDARRSGSLSARRPRSRQEALLAVRRNLVEIEPRAVGVANARRSTVGNAVRRADTFSAQNVGILQSCPGVRAACTAVVAHDIVMRDPGSRPVVSLAGIPAKQHETAQSDAVRRIPVDTRTIRVVRTSPPTVGRRVVAGGLTAQHVCVRRLGPSRFTLTFADALDVVMRDADCRSVVPPSTPRTGQEAALIGRVAWVPVDACARVVSEAGLFTGVDAVVRRSSTAHQVRVGRHRPRRNARVRYRCGGCRSRD